MLSDLFKIAAGVFGLLVGLPFAIACLKAGRAFGRSEEIISNLVIGLEKVAESLEHFAEKADGRLNDHDRRLTRVETKVEDWDGPERRRLPHAGGTEL